MRPVAAKSQCQGQFTSSGSHSATALASPDIPLRAPPNTRPPRSAGILRTSLRLCSAGGLCCAARSRATARGAAPLRRAGRAATASRAAPCAAANRYYTPHRRAFSGPSAPGRSLTAGRTSSIARHMFDRQHCLVVVADVAATTGRAAPSPPPPLLAIMCSW